MATSREHIDTVWQSFFDWLNRNEPKNVIEFRSLIDYTLDEHESDTRKLPILSLVFNMLSPLPGTMEMVGTENYSFLGNYSFNLFFYIGNSTNQEMRQISVMKLISKTKDYFAKNRSSLNWCIDLKVGDGAVTHETVANTFFVDGVIPVNVINDVRHIGS